MEDDQNNQIENTMFEDNNVTDVTKHIKKHKKPISDEEWPGAFNIFSDSARAMKVNGWYILGLLIIGATLSAIFTSLFHTTDGDPNFIATLLTIFSNTIIGLMVVFLTFAGVNSTKIDVSEAFEAIKELIVPGLILSALTWLIYAASIIALIVPFFFIMPRLILSLYIMVDQKKDAIESIKESWSLTRGQYGKVYGIIGVCLLLVICCLPIITIPFALYFMFMYSASFALLYIYLKNNQTK